MTRRQNLARRLSLLVVVAVAFGLQYGAAAAAPPPPPPPPPPAPPAPAPPAPAPGEDSSTSLIPVPAGCPAPESAAVVFTGIMVAKDDITQTVRFGIDQIRAGTADPWAGDDLIDIRYGPDYRFLVKGETYLVGAGIDPRYNALASTVRPPEPTFGGNDVIGIDDLALDCPEIDDPIRTLNVDGTTVDSGVLSLMTQDRRLLVATIMVPLGIVILALLALVLLRAFGAVAFRSVVGLGRAALTPVADHRATRVRKHRPREVFDWSGSPHDQSGADASERSDSSGVRAGN